MNKIFKVIFNHATQQFVVTSELGKNHTKSNSQTVDERGSLSSIALSIATAGAVMLGGAVISEGAFAATAATYNTITSETVTSGSSSSSGGAKNKTDVSAPLDSKGVMYGENVSIGYALTHGVLTAASYYNDLPDAGNATLIGKDIDVGPVDVDLYPEIKAAGGASNSYFGSDTPIVTAVGQGVRVFAGNNVSTFGNNLTVRKQSAKDETAELSIFTGGNNASVVNFGNSSNVVALGNHLDLNNSPIAIGSNITAHRQSLAVGEHIYARGLSTDMEDTAVAFGENISINNGQVGLGKNLKSTSINTVTVGNFNDDSGSRRANIFGSNNTVTDSANSTLVGIQNTITNSYNTTVIGADNALTYAYRSNVHGSNNTLTGTSGKKYIMNSTLAGFDNKLEGVIHNTTQTGNENVLTNANTSHVTGNANTLTTVTNATVIGNNQTVANSSATLDGVVAIGTANSVSGDKSIAIGYGNKVDAKSAGAFGDPTYIAAGADGSYSVGNNNYISTANTFALGNNIGTKSTATSGLTTADQLGTVENSVYLGSNSTAVSAAGKNTTVDGAEGATTSGGVKGVVNEATVNGTTYSGFAGTTPVGVVTVGASGSERRIQNVAAGEISATSTDAINGSQLYAVLDTIPSLLSSSGSAPKTYFHVNSEKTENLDAIDAEAQATGAEALAAGPNASAAGNNAVAVGVNANAAKSDTVAVGSGASATANGNVAIGKLAKSTGSGTVAIGDSAVASTDNSVALGKGSVTRASTVTTGDHSSNWNSPTDTKGVGQATGSVTGAASIDFKANSASNGVVSIGAVGSERQLINVAPGEVAVDSTDAVNGSQLYAIATYTGFNIKDDGTATSRINNNGIVDYASGTYTTATVTDGDNTAKVVYDVKVANVSQTTSTGAITVPSTDGVALASDVAKAINASGWNVKTSATTGGKATGLTASTLINPADTVNLQAGSGLTVNNALSGTTNTITYSVNVDDSTVKINDAGQLYVDSSSITATNNITTVKSSDNSIKVTPVTTESTSTTEYDITVKTTDLTNKGDGTITVPTDATGLTTAADVATAINDAYHTINVAQDTAQTIEGGAAQKVNAGDTVNYVAGKNLVANISVETDKGVTNVTYGLAENISVNNVTANNVTINNPANKDSGVVFKAENATPATNNPEGKAPTNALNITSSDGNPTQITGVGSTLNKQTVNTNPDADGDTETVPATLVNLTESSVNPNSAATVGDLQNMGWVVSAEDGYKDVVKNANEVHFNGTGLATVTGETNATTGVRTITVNVDAQGVAESAQLPVVYTTADGKKVYKITDPETNEVTFNTEQDGSGDTVKPADVIASMNNGDNSTTTPSTLTNVKGSLTPTYNVGDLEAAKDGDNYTGGLTKTPVTAFTTKQDAPTNVADIYTNAATVGDILNAGWNLRNNGAAKDFVKAYDTVNFVDGTGTTAVVEMNDDGTVANVTYNVNTDNDTITTKTVTNADGSTSKVLTANTTDTTTKDTGKADVTYTNANGDTLVKVGDTYYKAADVVDGKAVDNAEAVTGDDIKSTGDQLVNATTVTNAINNAFHRVDVAGSDETFKQGDSNAQNVNAGDKVVYVAGKNLVSKIEQESDSNVINVTYALQDDITVNSTTVNGTTITGTDGGLNLAKNVPATDTTPATTEDATLTGVTSGLSNYAPVAPADAANPTAADYVNAAKTDIVNLDNEDVPDNSVATVGDLRDMGWVVSTPEAGQPWADSVKNANEVQFVAGAGLKVQGTSEDDKRTITISLTDAGQVKVASDKDQKAGDITVKAGQVSYDTENPTGYVSAKNVADSINSAYHTINVAQDKEQTIAGGSAQKVNAGDTVNYVAGKNLVANISVEANGTTNVTYGLAENITVKNVNATESVKVGNVTISADTNKITGVENGDISATSKDAINGSQLYALGNSTASVLGGGATYNTTTGAIDAPTFTVVTNATSGATSKPTTVAGAIDAVNTATQQPITFVGNDGSTTQKLGSTLNIKGSLANDAAASSANLRTEVTNGNVEIKFAENPTFTTVNVGAAGSQVNIGGNAEGNLVVGNATTGAPVKITNVAPGTADTDAVNVSQLKGTAQKLGDQIHKVDKRARGGIAGVAATAGLPQVYIPGKSMVAAAAGTYRGEGAIAVGYSRASDNGKVIIKLTGSTNTQGDVTGTIGAGYQW
ncbi:YadA-like family protein [Lonepinella sp. BR2357]|uniref:YadA-like family protein n=1 Tax=Lonepinella sp. BR2357 TaxID=3434549 RepID=UPI003F6DD1FE